MQLVVGLDDKEPSVVGSVVPTCFVGIGIEENCHKLNIAVQAIAWQCADKFGEGTHGIIQEKQ